MQSYIPSGQDIGCIVPAFILSSKKLSLGAKFMYGVLCKFAYKKDHCWPSHKKLAEELGCSISSVKNYLRELVLAHFITVQKRNFNRSVYYLLCPGKGAKQGQAGHGADSTSPTIAFGGVAHSSCEDADCDAPLPDSDTPSSECDLPLSDSDTRQPNFGSPESNFDSPVAKFCPSPEPNSGYRNVLYRKDLYKYSQQNSLKELTCAGEPVTCEVLPPQAEGGERVDPEFDRVWKAYPKKISRGAALAAWKNLKKAKQLPSVTDILAAIERMSNSSTWQKEEGRFVPQLAKWLTNQGWFDEVGNTQTHRPASSCEINAQPQLSAQDLAIRQEHENWLNSIRPEFEALASKFSRISNKREAFAIWSSMRGKGEAPSASDVPPEYKSDLTMFLLEYRRGWRPTPQASSTPSVARFASVAQILAKMPPIPGGAQLNLSPIATAAA